MDLISQEEFKEIIQYTDDTCISIYLPTHKSGEETLTGKDAKKLKNQLKEIKQKLESMDWSGQKIDEFLKPATELLNNSTFWRHNAEGLVIFLAEGFSELYRLPIPFNERHYISNEFYIKPLLPLFTDDGRFNIISLGLKNIKLYEGTKHGITEIDIEDLIPSQVEDSVGYDWEQSMISFTSQDRGSSEGPGRSKSTFHGHSSDKADHKAEISRYLHEVDDGIMKLISDQTSPLLVASIDYLFPIYREANTYPHLWEEHISGNPTDKSESQLHEEALEILRPYFEKERKEKLDLYQQFTSTDKASSEIDSIIPACANGRVDTLFVMQDSDKYGTFNKENNTVSVDTEHKIGGNVSLLNLAVAQTILHGGQVYLMNQINMPEKDAEICAYYRY